MAKRKKRRYRLRHLDIDRVDLVDRGANQYAEIVLAKRDDSDDGDDVEKHYGPGPHASGSPQSVHGVGGGSSGGTSGPARPSSQPSAEKKPSGETTKSGHRPIATIAREIRRDWKKVNYAAAPYLDAMGSLHDISDNYFFDSGRSVVSYFLSNAQSWHGDKARAIKKELKDMLKIRKRDSEQDLMDKGQAAIQALKERKKKKGKKPSEAPQVPSVEPLKKVLEPITEGMIEADIFTEDATWQDFGDMLPEKVIDKLTEVVSAESAVTPPREENMAIEGFEDLDLPDELVDYISELEATVTDLSKSLDEQLGVSEEPQSDEERIEKALGELPEDVAAVLKADREAARAAAAESEAAIEKAETAEYIAKAATYAGVVDNAEEFGPMLRKVAAWDEEIAKSLEETLEAVTARLAKSALFEEVGTGIPGDGSDALAKATSIAKGYVEAGEEPSLEAARGRVWTENPDLFDEYQAEKRAEKV